MVKILMNLGSSRIMQKKFLRVQAYCTFVMISSIFRSASSAALPC